MCNTQTNLMCTPMETIVYVEYYGEDLTEEDTRFRFLEFSSDVVDTVRRFHPRWNARYKGALPTVTTTVFAMEGQHLSKVVLAKDKEFFENSVRNFLNAVFRKSSVKSHGVRLVDQTLDSSSQQQYDITSKVTSTAYDTADPYGNRHLLTHRSRLDVTAVVTGEYLPPPQVTVGDLVDESFAESGEYFVEELKKSDKFKGLRDLTTVSTTNVMVPTSRPTSMPLMASNQKGDGTIDDILLQRRRYLDDDHLFDEDQDETEASSTPEIVIVKAPPSRFSIFENTFSVSVYLMVTLASATAILYLIRKVFCKYMGYDRDKILGIEELLENRTVGTNNGGGLSTIHKGGDGAGLGMTSHQFSGRSIGTTSVTPFGRKPSSRSERILIINERR